MIVTPEKNWPPDKSFLWQEVPLTKVTPDKNLPDKSFLWQKMPLANVISTKVSSEVDPLKCHLRQKFPQTKVIPDKNPRKLPDKSVSTSVLTLIAWCGQVSLPSVTVLQSPVRPAVSSYYRHQPHHTTQYYLIYWSHWYYCSHRQISEMVQTVML